jgi:ketosteroid isomerase-like protein
MNRFLIFRTCLLLAVISIGVPAQTKSAREAKDVAAVRAVLETQVAAWNAGKLEDFMVGYWNSPDLSFFSGANKTGGWEATIARYRRTYQADGKEMGKLTFSDLNIEMLGPDAALVRGAWELELSNGSKPGGIYTLIFRRFRDGWKIIHDHTSSR